MNNKISVNFRVNFRLSTVSVAVKVVQEIVFPDGWTQTYMMLASASAQAAQMLSPFAVSVGVSVCTTIPARAQNAPFGYVDKLGALLDSGTGSTVNGSVLPAIAVETR